MVQPTLQHAIKRKYRENVFLTFLISTFRKYPKCTSYLTVIQSRWATVALAIWAILSKVWIKEIQFLEEDGYKVLLNVR